MRSWTRASSRYALVLSTRLRAANTSAVYTLATGWINDLYYGAGPDDLHYGFYGDTGSSAHHG